MGKRIFDLILSFLSIIFLFPVFLFVGIGICLSSPGPVFYKAARVGYKGNIFKMLKFRSMHVVATNSTLITSAKDSRIFRFGKFIRNYKLDELPQLFNILLGDMSIVGPRPEDPKIVDLYYLPVHKESLNVKPGLSSPGSLFNYTHVESQINDSDPLAYYVDHVLDTKVMLDVIYSRKANFLYDLSIIARTIKTIVLKALGVTKFSYPQEYIEISQINEHS